MSQFEACLLDYGNTVVEFDRRQIDFIIERLMRALRPIVGPVELETLRDAVDHVCSLPFQGNPPEYRELHPHAQMELLLKRGWGDAVTPTPDLVERCDRVLQDLFVEAVSIEPSALGCLTRLSRRVRLGLVSNYPCGRAIRRSLQKIRIDHLLDPVVISGEVGYVKPHGTLFTRALEAVGVPPDQVLFVGDRWDADMMGARRAGMRTCHHVGFTSDRSWKEHYDTYAPDYMITRLDQLDDILDGRGDREDESS